MFDVGRRRQHGTSQRDIQLRTNPTYPLMPTSDVNADESLARDRLVFSSSRSASNPTDNDPMIDENQSSPTVKITTNCSTLSTFVRLKEFLYDIFSLIKHLLLNLRFMGITCCAIVEALLIKGYLAFLSKHIEYQFRTTASHSSVYIGVISLFSVRTRFFFGSNEFILFFVFFQVIFGTPLGAYCVKRFDMNGRQCAKFCCIILALSSVIFLGLILHCREPTIGRHRKKNNPFIHLERISFRYNTFHACYINCIR